MPFTKKNYILMIIGVFTLILGFVIMSIDGEPYGFGFLGLTLGPLVVFLGFVLEVVAILYNPQKDK
ncbi:MAG: DUF3098 domain-containing protein [Cyclobacteriaceae bacterium]|nr:DUF3098 domain-containing protein [Cyclobacteriaceae bacterium]